MTNTTTTQPKSKTTAAAQTFLSLESIRDGVVILKGGRQFRAVLMVSSLNFALKSEDEQDALVYQYENFLNSLDFDLQFVVQSRRLNIQPYLDTLVARQKEEAGDLIKLQIGEYMEFVRSFVELSKVVAKTFYAIVPFEPLVITETRGFLERLLPGGKTAASAAEDDFNQSKNQLLQRVEAVELGLRRLGVRVVQLDTEELIELFYGLYNPTESQRGSVTTPLEER